MENRKKPTIDTIIRRVLSWLGAGDGVVGFLGWRPYVTCVTLLGCRKRVRHIRYVLCAERVVEPDAFV